MVRKAAIWLGVGATVAVGSVGYLAYQIKSARKPVATTSEREADSSEPVPVAEAATTVQATAAQGVAAADAPMPADPVGAVLKGNAALLSEQERALVAQLLVLDQGHLFEDWPEPGTEEELKRRLLSQLLVLDASYHGGIAAYVANARKLLQESRDGVNPFEGYVPSVPAGSRLDFASPEFLALEGRGLAEAGAAAFVLVAGGLGERLGYSGIKVALPCDTATGTPFLGLYITYILALQRRSGAGRRLPLAIMTSDDTHGRTVELLRRNNNFGMGEGQITLLKQEKVACLIDNAAHLALEPSSRWSVQTKPHGHGDVHMLLARSGLARSWLEAGFKWVCFFQDTNALVFRALIAALGVSAQNQYDMNSLAVPRRAKEAIGAIARLTRPDGSAPLTINVEYNQLDPLLRATVSPQGDVNDETGFSPFPGNINQLVLRLESYVPQLAATGGIISEFVNPKYQDTTKTAFKSSTRLECMMQDYPKALPPTAKVGFTTINQVWASYSPVKNSPADAAAKFKEGNPTHSATTGELDIYKANCLALQAVAGVELPSPLQTATFNGITTEVYPRVVLSPVFATTLADIKAKVAPSSLHLSPSSVLVLDGPDIAVQGPLELQGALMVRAVPGAVVRLGPLRVANRGWVWEPINEGETATEEERIRGFKVVHLETREFVFDKPGEYTVADEPPPQPADEAAAPPPPIPAVKEPEATPAPPPAAEKAAAVAATPAPKTKAAKVEEEAPAAPRAEEVTAAPVVEEAAALVTAAAFDSKAAAEPEPRKAGRQVETASVAFKALEPEAAPATDASPAAAKAEEDRSAPAPASPAPAPLRPVVVLSPDAKPFVPGGAAAAAATPAAPVPQPAASQASAPQPAGNNGGEKKAAGGAGQQGASSSSGSKKKKSKSKAHH